MASKTTKPAWMKRRETQYDCLQSYSLHRDGSVTLFDVYNHVWVRLRELPWLLESTLEYADVDNIKAHFDLYA